LTRKDGERMFFKGSRSVVGLDIGSSSIKVVELESNGDTHRLKDYGAIDLLPEAIVDGEVMDRQLVVETIQNLFESKKIRTRRVVSAVSGRAVIVKKILMDRLAEEDAKEAIHWEAEQHVPYDINDVSLDFQILDGEPNPKQMQVLLVAAKRDMLNAHADLIREAGLSPVVIDVDSFAVQNAILANYDFAADEVVALVNVGAEITNINIIQNGVPLFTQDLSLGGNTFVEAIMKRHNVSHAEATAAIRGDEAPSFDLAQVVQQVTEELAMAIERSVVYLKTSGDTERITRILLSGGGVRIPGIVELLNRRHQVPVEVADPLKRITHDVAIFDGGDPRILAPTLTVGIGLALRKVDDR
jgi:type IV pilus assembly protein PilM